MKTRLTNIYHSFPFQLLVLHFRSNLLLIGLWAILAFIMTGVIGQRLGLLYLFLDPEYLGAVNFWSFYFVGFAFGGFLMSWNLTTYLLNAHYFPFLASLERPFTKFCLNNFVLPISFLLFYLVLLIYFQSSYEGFSFEQIFLNSLGFLFGALTIVLFYSFYFHFTNRDIQYYIRYQKKRPPNLEKTIVPGRRGLDINTLKQEKGQWRVKTYLNESFRARLVRSVAHYDSSLLMSIFKQNHLNALVLQLLSMMVLLLLGYSIDLAVFRIPAGASILILFSLLVAILGAVTYWFDQWRATCIIIALILINYITSFDLFNHRNMAYGMSYQDSLATYTYERLQQVCLTDQVDKDKAQTINILNNWKAKVGKDEKGKPKMVILSVSGGGLKSALWSMKVIQQADSLLGGKLLDHTVLITGASGGILGTAYLRELYLQKQTNPQLNIYAEKYRKNISKDLLNPVAFTIVSNDLFLPWTKFEKNGKTYHKDRGYIFEQQFNENTHKILDKKLSDYQKPEADGIIPMLYLTPSIVNDGRRLIISPQGVSFMMVAPVGLEKHNTVEIDAVDFGWVFQHQEANRLEFLTALRMNATYPYILPNVHLPSMPGIEVMDAGFRDNYGILSATRFIQVFRSWIQENTSGVILVQISSTEKIEQIEPSNYTGMIESLFNPLGIAGKVLALQEFEHDNSLGFIFDLLGSDQFDVIRFFYRPSEDNQLEASVSFHMTAREKKDVTNAINLETNKVSMRQLVSSFE